MLFTEQAYRYYTHRLHPHMHIPDYVCKYANHLWLTAAGRVND